jgi:hypothetical protein
VLSLAQFPALAAFLAGAPSTWPDLRIPAAELLAICDAEELSPLVHHRLAGSSAGDGWPEALRARLVEQARALTAAELLLGAETRKVIDALVHGGMRPILIKGTALAYAIYDAPALRPRSDTDLLVTPGDVDSARRVMSSLGYATTVYCSDLFSQFEVQKVDPFGVQHTFDVHWNISTQPVFARLLTHDELLARAVPVPALGDAALAPHPIDALLLACVHPVMHHRAAERVLWVYDVHLLASMLTPEELDELAQLARTKKVAAICAHQLRLAQATFRTVVPASVFARLEPTGKPEPSAAYLGAQRRWHHELISSVRELRSTGDRVRLLREVLLPAPSYVLGAYGLRGKTYGPWVLPALYVHRTVRGIWKVLSGRK